MLLIFIVAFIAAFRFRAEAKRRGYEASKVTRYPLLTGGVLGVIALLMGLLAKLVLAAASMPENFQNVMQRVVEVFFLLIYLAIIFKSWKAIKQLPTRPKTSEPPTVTGG